jgi:hypothetical protein
MLITDKFLFVHQPKTGGTFVRHVIEAAAQAELADGPIGRLRRAGLLPRHYRYRDTADYHDTCNDIPAEQQGKQIVSAVRDPFDFYVSFYHYGWWAAHPEDSYRDLAAVKRAFPHFPDLSFDEFLELANRFFVDFELIGDRGDDHRLGYYSAQFVYYFFKSPAAAYAGIDEDYLGRRAWLTDMHPVDFLRTGRLNRDLHAYLRRAGYKQRYLTGVLDKPPVRPEEHFTKRPSAGFKGYYSRAAYELVRRKERLLLAIFPDLGGTLDYADWLAEPPPEPGRGA